MFVSPWALRRTGRSLCWPRRHCRRGAQRLVVKPRASGRPHRISPKEQRGRYGRAVAYEHSKLFEVDIEGPLLLLQGEPRAAAEAIILCDQCLNPSLVCATDGFVRDHRHRG